MKNDLNKVLLTGNVTRDSVLRHTAGGTAVADNSLAVNDSYGENKSTHFVELTFWGKQAETASKYILKGKPLLVEGRLKQESWEKDGVKRSRLSVTVEDFKFLPDGQKKKESDDEAILSNHEQSSEEQLDF